ncbi:hypothetical protein C9426_34625 [Serratia sp. S1B]|nr:hypothetical protein C9426_34625 [Serratia sp. S1B]
MWIFNLILILFSIVDLGLMFFLWRIGHHDVIIFAVLGGLFLFMVWLLYALNAGMSISRRQLKDKESRRNHIRYNAEGMIFDMPLFQTRLHIKWHEINAILLHSYPPREGDYYENRLDITLNTLPKMDYYHNIKWYNKFFKSKPSNYKDFIIYDDALGFIEFVSALTQYLNNVNPKAEQLLRQRFSGTHILFDRGGDTCNQILLEHRKNSF